MQTPRVGRRAAVCGKPIAHSLSPVIHNAGFAAAGLTGWSYDAIECAEAELPDLVAGLGPEWAGLSLTMPLKEVGLRIAATATPVAAAVGAANTLVRHPDGSWHADNTDVAGMVRVLRTAGLGPDADRDRARRRRDGPRGPGRRGTPRRSGGHRGDPPSGGARRARAGGRRARHPARRRRLDGRRRSRAAPTR